jgi:hypothetical protein
VAGFSENKELEKTSKDLVIAGWKLLRRDFPGSAGRNYNFQDSGIRRRGWIWKLLNAKKE